MDLGVDRPKDMKKLVTVSRTSEGAYKAQSNTLKITYHWRLLDDSNSEINKNCTFPYCKFIICFSCGVEAQRGP